MGLAVRPNEPEFGEQGSDLRIAKAAVEQAFESGEVALDHRLYRPRSA